MKVSQTLMISSFLVGCSTTPPQIPLCLPDRPELVSVSIEDQRALHSASPEGLSRLALNDTRLKAHLSTIEEIVDAYNRELRLGVCDTQL